MSSSREINARCERCWWNHQCSPTIRLSSLTSTCESYTVNRSTSHGAANGARSIMINCATIFSAQHCCRIHHPTCPSYLRAMTKPCDPWSTGTLRLVMSRCTLIRTLRGMTPAAASRNRKPVNSSVRIEEAKLKNRLRPGARSQDTCDTSCENGTSTIGPRYCQPIWRIRQHCGRKSALFWINRMRNLTASSRRTSSLTTFETRSAKSVIATSNAQPPVIQSRSCPVLSDFRPVSAEEISKIIGSSPAKHCAMDPAPTWLIKRLIPDLAETIAKMCNLSLSEGIFPRLPQERDCSAKTKEDEFWPWGYELVSTDIQFNIPLENGRTSCSYQVRWALEATQAYAVPSVCLSFLPLHRNSCFSCS